MKNKKAKQSEHLLRNGFYSAGEYGMPCMYRQEPDLKGLEFLSYHNSKNKTKTHKSCTIHFFIDDVHFTSVYTRPYDCLSRMRRYKQVLTPDFSVYTDMDRWRQIESVAHSRWCGAFWQNAGLIVIPTITWGDENSFDFCFDGVEKGCVLAVSSTGKGMKGERWLAGFEEMCRVLEPEKVLCYGKPFAGAERYADVLYVERDGNRIKKLMSKNIQGQKEFIWAEEA